ncbi:MAG: hypothetical protein COA79_22000 [Planctomycetota bacterium]|nr:MAG: hypothetical protein COA79_22000 [Planctomycetota bacterium]
MFFKNNILFKPIWRVFTFLFIVILALFVAYLIWTPGYIDRSKTIDMKKNGLWLAHGWIGADEWFEKYKKDKNKYRTPESYNTLNSRIKTLNIEYIFPHLCPSTIQGKIAKYDNKAIESLLNNTNVKVLPWIGGVLGGSAFPEKEYWRDNFVASIKILLDENPKLAGIHINIEPLPSGNKGFILLLKSIKAVIGENRILSLASYPPPSFLHPHNDVHWEKEYYETLSTIIDQHVVMMYDTALSNHKLYQYLYSKWVQQVLKWSANKEVLFGIPVYDDTGVGYHNPETENVLNAIKGLYSGLAKSSAGNYAGMSIYCNWELDEQEIETIKKVFINYK